MFYHLDSCEFLQKLGQHIIPVAPHIKVRVTLDELVAHAGGAHPTGAVVHLIDHAVDDAADGFAVDGGIVPRANLGGGFGIRYVAQDDPKALESYMEAVSKVVLGFCETNSFPVPFICIEPGRSIVGDTGITLYTIGSVKTIPGYRTYVSIDGGMTDNPRYALYQSAYEAVVANKAAQQKDFTATIAGRCCESGDLIQENTQLQTPAVGDILAVLSTGAYNYSMASNYNRVPRLPVVMVRGGEDSLAVRRETYEDLVRNDV